MLLYLIFLLKMDHSIWYKLEAWLMFIPFILNEEKYCFVVIKKIL